MTVTAGVMAAAMAAAPAAAPASTSRPSVGNEVGEKTIEDGGTGPYKAIQVGDASLTTHTIFRPRDLSAFGEKVKLPILAWGNGACSNSPAEHQNYLSEIASHGFLVIAIGPVQANGGARGGGGGTQSSQLIDAINWAIAQNKNEASRYYNKIDISRIGVFGHSCGGLQALEVSADPRITTTIVVDSGILNSGGGAPGRGRAVPTAPAGGALGPVMHDDPLFPVGAPGPGPGGGRAGGATRGGAGGGLAGMPPLTKDHLAKLHAPVFYLLGGQSDIAYANGMDDYKRIDKVPVFVANRDVGHGGTFAKPHGGDWAMVSVAWFKWQLKGDEEAAKLFTGNPPELSQRAGWTVDRKNLP